MVEFCKICGGMMLPSTDRKKKVLVCNLCGQTRKIDAEIIDSYTFIKEIEQPIGEEFKKLEEM